MKDCKVEERFSILFQANYFKVRQYAYNLLKSDFDAEDVAQEVFIKLWEQQELWLAGDGKISAYIMTVTRNIALNILKHQQIEQEYQNFYIHEIASYKQKDYDKFWEDIYNQEMLQYVYTILKKLPKRRGNIFKLSRFKGKNHKEIAHRMNISVHTVERQIYLTQVKLKRALYIFR